MKRNAILSSTSPGIALECGAISVENSIVDPQKKKKLNIELP
jgi:hypothetical protein